MCALIPGLHEEDRRVSQSHCFFQDVIENVAIVLGHVVDQAVQIANQEQMDDGSFSTLAEMAHAMVGWLQRPLQDA